MIEVIRKELTKKYITIKNPIDHYHLSIEVFGRKIQIRDNDQIEVRWLLYNNLALRTAKINKTSLEIEYNDFNKDCSEGKQFIEITEEIKDAMRPNSIKFIESL